ncbi:hypothetical protein ACFLUY_02415 [Chloroflexota bacterium]
MYILSVLSTIVVWGWSPILIMALAIVGIIYEWEIWVIASVLGIILVIGLVMAVIRVGERRLELLSMSQRQLAGYFSRRFMGTSSLSIFAIIDTLFNLDDPQLWDWARACDMSARLFNTWCDSFIDRIESDTRTGRFRIYLRIYLNELWLLNNHYHEFVEQFYEIAEKIEIPPATKGQYDRFAVEYNTFVQNFREHIVELRKIAGTEIESPSVKLANELSRVKPLQTSQGEEAKPSQATQDKGYYM